MSAKLRKKRNLWFIVFRDPATKKETWLRIGKVEHITRAQAQEAFKKMQAKLVNQRFRIKTFTKSPFSEFSEKFLKHAKETKAPATYRHYRDRLAHLLKFYRTAILMDIDGFSIERYKMMRASEVKPKTVNLELSCLRALLNCAVRWGYLDETPFRNIQLLKLPKKPPRFFSKSEIQLLLKIADPWIKPFLTIGLNTGMRRGEILNLRWKHVDLEHRKITVQSDGDFTTKNYEYRTIPINNQLYEELVFLKKFVPTPRRSGFEPRQHCQMEYVLCHKNGARVKEVKRAFKTLCRKAGIEDASAHTMRHTFASHLLMAGVDLPTIKEFLGHHNIQTTMIYTHVAPEHLTKKIEMVNRGLDFKNAEATKPEAKVEASTDLVDKLEFVEAKPKSKPKVLDFETFRKRKAEQND